MFIRSRFLNIYCYQFASFTLLCLRGANLEPWDSTFPTSLQTETWAFALISWACFCTNIKKFHSRYICPWCLPLIFLKMWLLKQYKFWDAHNKVKFISKCLKYKTMVESWFIFSMENGETSRLDLNFCTASIYLIDALVFLFF